MSTMRKLINIMEAAEAPTELYSVYFNNGEYDYNAYVMSSSEQEAEAIIQERCPEANENVDGDPSDEEYEGSGNFHPPIASKEDDHEMAQEILSTEEAQRNMSQHGYYVYDWGT